MAKARQIVFRIFYSTSFTVVFLIQIAFICVTPADALYESYKRRRILDIFLISGAYVLTALIAALIYASRLYTNRAVIKGIPKTYIPIEKEDLPGRRVHKLIQECLERSAVIAYEARPRSTRIEHETVLASERILTLTNSRMTIDPKAEPRWGKIDHPGWSSPAAQEMPSLEYATVIDELTDLIEAKAVSLAPIDHLAEPAEDGTPLPNPKVIDELARHETWGMRSYLDYLMEIGVVPETALTEAFLGSYERARFSSQPLSEQEFQTLMRLFAEILRSMKPVEVDLLDLDDSSSDTYRSEGSSFGYQHAQHEYHDAVRHETASIVSTVSDFGSVRRHHPQTHPRSVSEDSVPSESSAERDAINGNNLKPDQAEDGNESDDESSRSNSRSRASLRTAPTNISTSAPRSRSRHSNALTYHFGSGSRSQPHSQSTSRMFSAPSQPQSHSNLGLNIHSQQPSARSSESLHSSRSGLSHLSNSTTSRGRSGRRNGASPAGSVIRLARPDEDDGSDLPFRYIR